MTTLTDIMPWEKLVAYEKEINERTGLNSCIIDREGVRITAYCNWANPLCPMIRAEAKVADGICSGVHKLLSSDLGGKKAVVARCGAGMMVLGIPVYKDGILLGMVGGCGLLPENEELDALAVSTITGLGISRIKKLCGDITHLKPEEIEALVQYLRKRFGNISRTLQV